MCIANAADSMKGILDKAIIDNNITYVEGREKFNIPGECLRMLSRHTQLPILAKIPLRHIKMQFTV
jgi:hypothetical protein